MTELTGSVEYHTMKNNLVALIIWGILLFTVTALSGCRGYNAITAMDAHAKWNRLNASGPLPAVGWARGQSDIIHIYIEGDGVAYSTPTSPSPDPTPITPTALLLAQQDSTPAVAYLGRPCQYVEGSACTNEYWTTGRFSLPVLTTMNSLTEAAKKAANARNVVLIGFSGGGAVAALLASQRTDVVGLITVCGNLDHEKWTRMHDLTPLQDSLNPADYTQQLSSIPQVHFLGGNDTVIPQQVVDSYVEALSPKTKVQVRTLPELTHDGKGWVAAWPTLIKEATSIF
ncbi:MAG: alpha/beta hydrolase [Desulfovibrio sp.]|nr:alpha/beta hydrolase [Desulfovibrio sp.]